MDKKINENLLKISGKFPIERALELGEEVEITLKGGIVKKEIYDLQDGSVNVVYLLKPTEIIKL